MSAKPVPMDEVVSLPIMLSESADKHRGDQSVELFVSPVAQAAATDQDQPKHRVRDNPARRELLFGTF